MSTQSARCPICRYDLTGLIEPRCPECGEAFTPTEWVRRETLVPAPALERLVHLSLPYALWAMFIVPIVRPWRFLRGIRHDRGWLRPVAFFPLQLALAGVLATLITIGTAEILRLVADSKTSVLLDAFTLSRHPWTKLLTASFWIVFRTTVFLLTSLIVWLPTLVILHLTLWHSRRAFRTIGKALMYTMVWWFWPIVIMAGAVSRYLVRIDNDWMWGFRGGWSNEGAWPWVCWLAAALTTAQFVALRAFVRSPQCVLAEEPARTRRTITTVLTVGWLVAMYLLLIDRHVLRRFYLHFAVERLADAFD